MSRSSVRGVAALVAATALCSAAGCGDPPASFELGDTAKCLARQQGAIVSTPALENFGGLQGASGAIAFMFPLQGGEPPAQGYLFVARTAEGTARIAASFDKVVDKIAKRTHTTYTGAPSDLLQTKKNVVYYWAGEPTQAGEEVLAACLDG